LKQPVETNVIEEVKVEQEQKIIASGKKLTVLTEEMISKLELDNYKAPELYEGDKHSIKTDIWALGVVFFQLCELTPPFDDVKSLLSLTPPPIHHSYSVKLK
jgi:serine/threonine protein kinase